MDGYRGHGIAEAFRDVFEYSININCVTKIKTSKILFSLEYIPKVSPTFYFTSIAGIYAFSLEAQDMSNYKLFYIVTNLRINKYNFFHICLTTREDIYSSDF